MRAKWQVSLNQFCKAVLHPQMPQSIPVNIGQQGGVAGPSHMAQCLLILHPAVTRSVPGSGGFSCPQFACLRPLPCNPGVPKPTASASLHPSDGTSVEPALSKSLIGTRLAGPFFPYDLSIGPVPSCLILIELDTEMPVERKECAGLAAPFPSCFTAARFGLTQP